MDTECAITEVHGLKAASHEGPGSGGGTGYTVIIVNLCYYSLGCFHFVSHFSSKSEVFWRGFFSMAMSASIV